MEGAPYAVSVSPAKPKRLPRRIAPFPEQLAWVSDFRPALVDRAEELFRDNIVRAEDLVQETLVRWWERPPRTSTPQQFKRWLRTVMLNLYRGRWPYDREEDVVVAGLREKQFEDVEDDW